MIAETLKESSAHPLADLAMTSAALQALEDEALMPEERYNLAAALVHRLTAEIVQAERANIPRGQIADALAPARAVHRTSPFIRHCQDWPRGYAGDFEMIGWLLAPRVQARPDTVGHALERLALHCPPAQQHRNKVEYQARLVTRTIRDRPSEPRILSIGCGGAQDLIAGLAEIHRPVHLVLNDLDPAATRHASSSLAASGRRIRLMTENALVAGRRLAREREQFDLILAGGLIDYLDDRTVVRLLRLLSALISENGRLYFSNMAPGNPYRAWMDYLFEWRLIERDEDSLTGLLAESGIVTDRVRIRREGTGLACLVEVRTAT